MPAPDPPVGPDDAEGQQVVRGHLVEVGYSQDENIQRFRAIGNSDINIENPPSASPLLRKKLLCVYRPEILATLEAPGLYTLGQPAYEHLTTAGEMFSLRKDQRSIEEEVVRTIVNELKEDKPELFESTLNQYESVLASASTNISSLKMLFLTRNYALLGPYFKSFAKNYTRPDLSIYNATVVGTLGGNLRADSDFQEYMINIDGSFISQSSLKSADSAILFLQVLLSTVHDSTIGYRPSAGDRFVGFSESLGNNPRDLSIEQLALIESKVINSSYGPDPFNSLLVSHQAKIQACSSLLSRELTPSIQLYLIKSGDTLADGELQAIVESKMGASFLYDSTSDPRVKSLLYNLAGLDPWSKTKISPFTNYDIDARRKYITLPSLENSPAGVVKNIFLRGDPQSYSPTKILINKTSSLYPQSSLSYLAYESQSDITDEIFSNPGEMNISKYNEITENLRTSCAEYASAMKTLFRVGDKVNLQANEAPQHNAAAAERDLAAFSPLSPGRIYTKVLKLFNQRAVGKISKVWSRGRLNASYGFGALEAYEHENTGKDANRLQAYILMRDNPDFCVRILESFLDDYMTGYLTFDGQTGTYSGTNSDPESKPVIFNISPVTNARVNLSGNKPSLQSLLSPYGYSAALGVAGFNDATDAELLSLTYTPTERLNQQEDIDRVSANIATEVLGRWRDPGAEDRVRVIGLQDPTRDKQYSAARDHNYSAILISEVQNAVNLVEK